MTIKLEARNYRALRQAAWAPSPVCVVVGPNGSGKTTLLNLFEFCRNVYLRGGPAALDAQGGAWGLRHWAASAEEGVAVALTAGDLRWELQLSVRGASIDERLGETITRGGETILSRALFSDQVEFRGEQRAGDERVGLRLVYEATKDPELEPLVTALERFRVYRSYNLGGLRQNGSRQSADLYLQSSGDNAFTVLRNWRDRRELRPQYQFVLDGLREAFPEVCADIDFDLAGLTVSVGMIQPGREQAVPAYFWPNGCLTGLLHLCAVAGAQPGSVVSIDEMENTLHPYAIRRIVEAFRAWSEERDLTICLASHSPVLLDEFKDEPSSVFVMGAEEDKRPTPLTELFDPEWLAHFSLGKLYAHGEFGGQAVKNNAVRSG